jgi:hypothetical protein
MSRRFNPDQPDSELKNQFMYVVVYGKETRIPLIAFSKKMNVHLFSF